MNEDDSEQIASLLMSMGCARATAPEHADIVILVTCSVRAKPEEKAKSKLGELALLKKSRPDMIIGVCGCMAQRVGESLRKKRPYLDFVVGTGAIQRIPALISQIDAQRGFRSELDLPAGEVPKRVGVASSALKSFVPVTYGCDNFCAYCVVPYVRGRERSRSVEEITQEVRGLGARGRKEITLLGQNVNSYRPDFAELLRALSDVDGIQRIRFTTSHPKDLSDALIEAMADLPKVCEHIHLAVQSGDNDVLSRMNRRYTRERVLERVSALRAAVPSVAITTDFLVGFPGETEEQFENTLRLAEEVRFDAAFMFGFNVIPNTAAEKMEGHLSNKVINEMLNRLIKIQNAITCEINTSQVGSVYEVLVESASPKDPNRLTGLTRQNKTTNFPGSPDLIGRLVGVRATEGHLYGFVGEVDSSRP